MKKKIEFIDSTAFWQMSRDSCIAFADAYNPVYPKGNLPFRVQYGYICGNFLLIYYAFCFIP